MPTDTLEVICYGKLPGRGDFVRSGASRGAVRALDRWLQEGLHAAKRRQPAGFAAAYDTAPAYGFVFHPKDGADTLAGVLRPSRDRSGRRFPFVIALEVNGPLLGANGLQAQLPAALDDFMAQAHTLAGEAVGGQLEHDEIAARLGPVRLPAAAAPAANGWLRAYRRYLQETTFASFWEALPGPVEEARKHLLFKNMTEILLPMRRRLPARLDYGLEFPLVPGANGYGAGFWAEVCLRLLRAPEGAPTCFWTLGDAPEGRPALLLFLRPPPARAFAHLLPGARASDHLCVLDRMGTPELAADALPQRYRRLLGDPQLTLWDLLQRLE